MTQFFMKIFRGDSSHQFWETFALDLIPYANVIAYLMIIQRSPINVHGRAVDPISWESGCLEEVCGSCSMLINGVPRQGCSALVDHILAETGSNTIQIAPLSKFPLIRDLLVDRTRMFEDLKRVHAWIETDEQLSQMHSQTTVSQETQQLLYALSKCMTCGCCLEACPQVNHRSKFIGPAAIAQARLFDANPLGGNIKAQRIRSLMEEGGVSDCGHSQNCVRVCPKELPLTDSIAALSRATTRQALRDIFKLPDSP